MHDTLARTIGYFIFDEPLRKAAAKAKARQSGEEGGSVDGSDRGKDGGNPETGSASALQTKGRDGAQ